MRSGFGVTRTASAIAGMAVLMLLRVVVCIIRSAVFVIGPPLALAGVLLVVGTLVFGFWGEVGAIHAQRWALLCIAGAILAGLRLIATAVSGAAR